MVGRRWATHLGRAEHSPFEEQGGQGKLKGPGMGALDDLTENEGSLLAVIIRDEPITAYQLVMIYEQSPVSSFNTSKGAVYPIIRRLKERGFVVGERVTADKRGTEALKCTSSGLGALKRWVRAVQPGFTLLADPLRTRILSLDLLSRDEQLEWIVETKRLVAEKKAEVAGYDESVTIPFQDVVTKAAQGSLDATMKWLDELLFIVVKADR